MEPFSALLTICAGNSPVPGEFPAQRPVTRSFDVFFDLRLYKRLSKQWWACWFETLSRSLWRHRNERAPWYWCVAVCWSGVITNVIWSYFAELTQTDNYHNNARNNFILTSLIAYLVIQSFFLLITWQDITQQRLTAQSVILYWSRVVIHKIVFPNFSLSAIIEIIFEWLQYIMDSTLSLRCKCFILIIKVMKYGLEIFHWDWQKWWHTI